MFEHKKNGKVSLPSIDYSVSALCLMLLVLFFFHLANCVPALLVNIVPRRWRAMQIFLC